ncbi:hypothetical protein GGR02_002777 [Anoxybacillus voinovskiensis]|uniref:DUF2521 domain-containing protein n=1 Tax=Anoxybacteroides voinovskiense TaxID=230470 RepID=A0A840DTW7_9BACL|nr:DUF2521 family protein [Anoxybacillus voinovskiensis]MBB4074982.1 hypothetical protein [Anoxybacillus voinovskiensis]GGJ75491.1 hypothetical protein GCM10008982_25930 [Anoxybacillus voinovskiensis]
MNVITSFKEKKREKEIKYERKLLRELSLDKLQRKAGETFRFFYPHDQLPAIVEDGCIDMAIEAYLLGASYSRFGYYGEPVERVKARSAKQEQYLADALFEFFCFFGNRHERDAGILHDTCARYISYWWMEGFETGKKRWRLKLH